MRISKRWLISLVALSILLNLISFIYGIRKVITKIKETRNQETIHRKIDSLTYMLGRDQLFKILPKDTGEIIMLGNSLTQNFEWHEMFKGKNIKNRGIYADVCNGVLLRLNDILERKPNKIFIEIGINDILKGMPTDSITNVYRLIISRIKTQTPSTKIYVQSILPTANVAYGTDFSVFLHVVECNKQLLQSCQELSVTYIDLFPHFVSGSGLNPAYDCGDHLHLNARGYRLWCSILEKYL